MAQQKRNWVAIITMFFIFGMIAFVTNMAAPFGNIWGMSYDWAGMMGNMMNFAAYLFMGIPAGNMLIKYGYKKTALIALIVKSDQPGIQCYTGNFLDGTLTGKNGVVYQHRTGICLETQRYPDSPNKPEWPTTVLRPGEDYHTVTVFEFHNESEKEI